MNNFFKLVKILIKTTELTTEEKKRSKVFYIILGVVAVCCIMIPAAIIVGVITYALTTAMVSMGGDNQGLQLVLHIISLFTFVFGLNVIFNVFYFSEDLQHLMPLPIKPSVLVGAKFTYALLSENIMQFILVAGAFAGYVFATKLGFVTVISAFIGVITLPIVPLSYCAIICLIVMYCTKFIKSKDNVSKVTIATAFIILAFLIFGSGCIRGFDITAVINDLFAGDGGFFTVMNTILPHIQLLARGVSNNDILSLLGYLLINGVFVSVFLLLAKIMYFKGVAGVTSTSCGKQISHKKLIAGIKVNSPLKSYIKKEFIMLFKTPAFFLNCVSINLLFPIALTVIIVLQQETGLFNPWIQNYQRGDSTTHFIITIGIVVLSLLLTAVNTIASSSIIREGKHFAFMKYIPLDIKAQLNAKALTSIIISSIGLLVFIFVGCIYLNANFLSIVSYMLISLLSVVFMSYMGLFMDTINPKLIWEDEINALRGNYNVFFNMALSMIISLLVCGIFYILFVFVSVDVTFLSASLIILLTATSILFYKICTTKGVINIEKTQF